MKSAMCEWPTGVKGPGTTPMDRKSWLELVPDVVAEKSVSPRPHL
jgi:hypothetical protein